MKRDQNGARGRRLPVNGGSLSGRGVRGPSNAETGARPHMVEGGVEARVSASLGKLGVRTGWRLPSPPTRRA